MSRQHTFQLVARHGTTEFYTTTHALVTAFQNPHDDSLRGWPPFANHGNNAILLTRIYLIKRESYLERVLSLVLHWDPFSSSSVSDRTRSHALGNEWKRHHTKTSRRRPFTRSFPLSLFFLLLPLGRQGRKPGRPHAANLRPEVLCTERRRRGRDAWRADRRLGESGQYQQCRGGHTPFMIGRRGRASSGGRIPSAGRLLLGIFIEGCDTRLAEGHRRFCYPNVMNLLSTAPRRCRWLHGVSGSVLQQGVSGWPKVCPDPFLIRHLAI